MSRRSSRSRARKRKKLIILLSSLVLAVAIGTFAFLTVKKNNEGKKPVTRQTSADTEVISFEGADYVPNDDVVTFLVIGTDDPDGDAESSAKHKQADFILLLAFNKGTEEISALQISRDTITDVNMLSIDGSKIKTVKEQIALAYAEGDGRQVSCRNTSDSVSSLLFGTKIDYYISLTMDAVPIINDSVGGISVTIDEDMTAVDPTFKKGETVKLSGEQALRFVRARGELDDSSNAGRMERQKDYLLKLFSAVKSKSELSKNYLTELFPELSGCIVTNCSSVKIRSIWEDFSKYSFSGFTDIKGESKAGEKFMEFYPDNDSLQKTVVDLFYKKKE